MLRGFFLMLRFASLFGLSSPIPATHSTMTPGDPLLNYSSHQYGDNVLQNVGVWQFTNEAHKPGEGHWIM